MGSKYPNFFKCNTENKITLHETPLVPQLHLEPQIETVMDREHHFHQNIRECAGKSNNVWPLDLAEHIHFFAITRNRMLIQ